MGVKLSTLYWMSSSSNELERKGIPKDHPNGATNDSKQVVVPKVTQKELLDYGEKTLDTMQKEQIDALTVENLSLGNDYDRSIESARLKQTHAMQSLTEKQMGELEPEMKNWSRRKYLLIPLNLCLLYSTFKYPRHLSNFTRKWI